MTLGKDLSEPTDWPADHLQRMCGRDPKLEFILKD